MKTNRILCLCAAITLPQLALAELPFNDQSLGTSQATVDFCTQADPVTAAKYRQQLALMVQDAPADELAKVRSTDEYKVAYARTSATLGEIAKPEVADACNRFLEVDKHADYEADKQAIPDADKQAAPDTDKQADQSAEKQDQAVERLEERAHGADVEHL